MFELSLHILDLVENSVAAGAKLVRIRVLYDEKADTLTIEIEDDGKGMDAALLARVTSPFSTTRTTRKVGLGIPMIQQLSQMCEGTFSLSSTPGVGTLLKVSFRASHVDLPPLGDLKGTMRTLVVSAPEGPDFLLEYRVGEKEFVFDTREIRAAVGSLPLNEPEILSWITEYLDEGFASVGEA